MRERYLLGMTAVPFVVAALLPGALLAGNEVTRFEDPEIVESSGLASSTTACWSPPTTRATPAASSPSTRRPARRSA